MKNKYLRATDVIDWRDESIVSLARSFRAPNDNIRTAKSTYDWVRDEVRHSYDYQMNPVTCKASEVLKHMTGYCFAKSHLLAALLRANGIPTGFCYQRLSLNDIGPPYSLHGLNAVFLEECGWYRVDARGNKIGVDAQFMPPIEKLAFACKGDNEYDLPGIWPDPLPIIVSTLKRCATFDEVFLNLPDINSIEQSNQAL